MQHHPCRHHHHHYDAFVCSSLWFTTVTHSKCLKYFHNCNKNIWFGFLFSCFSLDCVHLCIHLIFFMCVCDCQKFQELRIRHNGCIECLLLYFSIRILSLLHFLFSLFLRKRVCVCAKFYCFTVWTFLRALPYVFCLLKSFLLPYGRRIFSCCTFEYPTISWIGKVYLVCSKCENLFKNILITHGSEYCLLFELET